MEYQWHHLSCLLGCMPQAAVAFELHAHLRQSQLINNQPTGEPQQTYSQKRFICLVLVKQERERMIEVEKQMSTRDEENTENTRPGTEPKQKGGKKDLWVEETTGVSEEEEAANSNEAEWSHRNSEQGSIERWNVSLQR